MPAKIKKVITQRLPSAVKKFHHVGMCLEPHLIFCFNLGVDEQDCDV